MVPENNIIDNICDIVQKMLNEAGINAVPVTFSIFNTPIPKLRGTINYKIKTSTFGIYFLPDRCEIYSESALSRCWYYADPNFPDNLIRYFEMKSNDVDRSNI